MKYYRKIENKVLAGKTVKALRYVLAVLPLCMFTTSCNDWLDVRPDTENKEKDQFASQKGFETAITGCYMAMAERDIYGERLTMTNIENLANLWNTVDNSDNTARQQDYALAAHDYGSDFSKAAVAAMYKGLFNTVVQANMIIKHGLANGEVIASEEERNCIIGEAYAIRAYCQLDVLRLFGQMPAGGTKSVMLPYCETTNIDEMPPYYSYADYLAKLKDDIANAKKRLKDNDPLFKYTFSQMHGTSQESNSFMIYRQFRMNYYAVCALEARMSLYVGDTAAANAIAMELINAKGADGKALRPLSGLNDFSVGYKLCPNECLFALSKHDVKEYAASSLVSSSDSRYNSASDLALSLEMLEELFAGQNISSHNRYLYAWNRRVADAFGKMWAGCSKYNFADDVQDAMLYYQIIPMLRTSELYLIAMETGNNLDEVNRLYAEYMLSHNVGSVTPFTSLDEARDFVLSEYRREFFAEGQMFYTYKRLGTVKWLWRSDDAVENDYLLPLPETEFNPNGINNK